MATRTLIGAIAIGVLATTGTTYAQGRAEASQWTNPYYLIAGTPADKFTITGGEVYSSLHGRAIESRNGLATLSPIDNVMFWYGVQSNVVKGHASTSRLHASSNTMGIRWVYSPARYASDPSWAIQFEKVTPGVAESHTSSSSETFNPTKNFAVSLIHGTGTGSNFAIGYANVKGAASGNADVATLTYGTENGSDSSGIYMQAQAIGQRWTGPATSDVVEVKAMFTLCYRMELVSHVDFSLEGTYFPFGLPMSAGSVTGLSSFLIYEPGGPADGLRKDQVGFAAARITWKQHF